MNMNLKIILRCFIFMLLCSLLSGCANPYKATVLPYSIPASPNNDETLIYVFREDSVYASGRKLGIICNDTIMAVLSPATFSHFIVKSGENEIVGYIAPSPIMHYRVQDRPGQVVYLMCKLGYATGMFMEEIDEQNAKMIIEQYNYIDIEVKNRKAKANYKTYYDNLYK